MGTYAFLDIKFGLGSGGVCFYFYFDLYAKEYCLYEHQWHEAKSHRLDLRYGPQMTTVLVEFSSKVGTSSASALENFSKNSAPFNKSCGNKRLTLG